MKKVFVGLLFSLMTTVVLAQGSLLLGTAIIGFLVYDDFKKIQNPTVSLPPFFDPEKKSIYFYNHPKSVIIRPEVDPKLIWVDGIVFRREFMYVNNNTIEVLVPQ
jgi:hypothetical protein